MSPKHLPLLALLFVAGCPGPDPMPGTDSGPMPTLDGGRDAPPAVIDREAPTVTSTTPDDGSTDVARSTAIEVTFSEPMGPVGTVTIRAEGTRIDDATLDLDGTTLTITPADAWPASSEIEVRLATDFEDLAGNALASAFVFRFTTNDDLAPRVVSSTPAEGAVDVEAHLGALQIVFDEPMDQAAGSALLEGGPGAIDLTSAVWSASAVTYAVSGLANDVDYRVVLSGFTDRGGTPLDGTPVLGDGAIDFTTRADDEAPRVVSSSPTEGQVDVSPAALGGLVRVTFDEVMDETVVSVPFDAGGSARTAPVDWVSDRVASIDVSGAIVLGAVHHLDLRGVRDAAGNVLALTPVVGDGILDFTTGTDAFVPYVVASQPAEGATNVPIPLRDVRLAFSEAMDESIATVTLVDGTGTTTMVDGVWESSGTTLVVPGSAFVQGRAYHLDVRALRDRAGSAVSADHGYLGDGRLDFTITRPTGASCAEPLLLELATPLPTGAGVGIPGFVVTSAGRTRDNGSGSCDADGIQETDAVILVHKTTPALGDPSGAGRALRIRTFSVSNRANIEVFRGICDPSTAIAADAGVRCATYHDNWNLELDVPAGDYYVWVSTATGSPTDIRVAIDEVAARTDGSACESAWDDTSAIYTAPSTPSGPHVYELPGSPIVSSDITESNAPFEAFSCAEEVQDDVVLTYEKLADDTVLEVFVRPPGFFNYAEVVVGGCSPLEAGASRARCEASIGAAGRRFDVRAPAGPVSVWLGRSHSSQGFQGAHVEIRELPAPTAPGSSCATAIPITAGTGVAITPTHAARYDAPSCFGTDANVTWYSFEPTEEMVRLLVDAPGAVSFVDAASGREVGCSTNAVTTRMVHVAPSGTRVCVAVESNVGIGALTLEPIDYGGVGGALPVPLGVGRPALEGTLFEGQPVTGDTWMAVTPSRFYTNLGTAGVIEGPRGGGRAIFRDDADGRVLGDAGVTIGEALFTMNDTAGTSRRLFRLATPAGVWDPQIWDLGPTGTYPELTETLATDGTTLFAVDLRSRTEVIREANVYAFSASAPSAPTVTTLDRGIYNVEGLAVDDQYLYLFGQSGDVSPGITGLFRVARSGLGATPAPVELVHAFATTTFTTSGPSAVFAALVLDDLVDPRYLYVRTAGDIHVIEEPDGAFRYLGIVHDGLNGDRAIARDPVTDALWLFSTEEDVDGEWVRLD